MAKEGSLAAAARFLGLVPSAMSYRIRRMEEGLDVLLVDRRGVTRLTAAGQELVVKSARKSKDACSITGKTPYLKIKISICAGQ